MNLNLPHLVQVCEAATPGPWSQGRTLLTSKTKRWRQDMWDANEVQEKRRVFACFTHVDEGRGRELVAECLSEQEAAFIATFNPSTVLAILRRLMAAQERVKELEGDQIVIKACANINGNPSTILKGLEAMREIAENVDEENAHDAE